MSAKVVIVPCSGIGKAFGSVTREAAYLINEELRPDSTTIVPLALLVLGDEATRAEIQNAPVITLDGCKLGCARVNVGLAGGQISKEISVLDFYRQNRELKPEGISQLNEAGLELARRLAAAVAEDCDALCAGGTDQGGYDHA